jgi:hypothetical protein
LSQIEDELKTIKEDVATDKKETRKKEEVAKKEDEAKRLRKTTKNMVARW